MGNTHFYEMGTHWAGTTGMQVQLSASLTKYFGCELSGPAKQKTFVSVLTFCIGVGKGGARGGGGGSPPK